ncbi:MAG: hypothetical protein ACWGHP_10655 [Stenotrophomonas sp.]
MSLDVLCRPRRADPCRARKPCWTRIAGFELHRGILALGRKAGAAVDLDKLLDGLPDRRPWWSRPSGIGNHDNVGGLFRNAAAFGAAAVLLDPDLLRPLLPQGDPRLGRRGAAHALASRPDADRHDRGCCSGPGIRGAWR